MKWKMRCAYEDEIDFDNLKKILYGRQIKSQKWKWKCIKEKKREKKIQKKDKK